MIQIAIADLRKFFSYASAIKDSRVIPVYAYTKIVCDGDQATLYKTNGYSFVKFSCPATFEKNCTFLIEEKSVSGFIVATKGKNMTFTIDATNKVAFTDGKRNGFSQAIADAFPAIPEKGDDKPMSLSSDLLSALYIAKNHTMPTSDKHMRPWFTYVHIAEVDKKHYVIGSNGNITFFKAFKEKLPDLCLETEVITVISKFRDISYTRSEKFDYFDCVEVCYGFQYSNIMVNATNISALLDKFKYDKYFIIDRQEMLDLCNTAIKMNTSHVPAEISLTNGGKKSIMLTFVSMAGDVGTDDEIKCDKKNFDPNEFLFSPEKMIIVLNDLGCEKIKMSYIENHLLFTTDEDPGYVGALINMQRLQQPVVKQ